MQLIEIDESCDKFYVAESTIENAGMGLFAKEPLPMGFKLDIVGFFVQKNTPSEICTRHARDYRIQYQGDWFLIPTGWAAMANHTRSNPNAILVKSDSLFLQMTRPIAKNEEILYEYSDAVDIKFNIRTGGNYFAVVCQKDDKIFVKEVTPNLAQAWRTVESWTEKGFKCSVQPTHLDISELKGNL